MTGSKGSWGNFSCNQMRLIGVETYKLCFYRYKYPGRIPGGSYSRHKRSDQIRDGLGLVFPFGVAMGSGLGHWAGRM